MKKNAIIVLHEIYGINDFIRKQCLWFEHMGFAILCPNMINRECFHYHDAANAYAYFMSTTGFDYYHEINRLITQLKTNHDKVFVVGYSVGATLAWLCCEHTDCDGIIACYGSRIRDYTQVNPICPVLLLAAKEQSFDINEVIRKLQKKANLEIIKFDADHGFLDAYSTHYNEQLSKKAEENIVSFLSDLMSL